MGHGRIIELLLVNGTVGDGVIAELLDWNAWPLGAL